MAGVGGARRLNRQHVNTAIKGRCVANAQHRRGQKGPVAAAMACAAVGEGGGRAEGVLLSRHRTAASVGDGGRGRSRGQRPTSLRGRNGSGGGGRRAKAASDRPLLPSLLAIASASEEGLLVALLTFGGTSVGRGQLSGEGNVLVRGANKASGECCGGGGRATGGGTTHGAVNGVAATHDGPAFGFPYH